LNKHLLGLKVLQLMSLYRVVISVLIIALVLNTSINQSAFRKTYDIQPEGKMYILEFEARIIMISDYGVFSLYLSSDGGYCYGITILKHPDEETTHLYLMTGSQDQWRDGGLFNIDNVKFRIILNLENNTMLVYSNIYNGTFNLTYTPLIKKLYISAFNVTSRKADHPNIIIRELRVYVLNDTVVNTTVLKDLSIDLGKEYRNNIVLNQTNIDTYPPPIVEEEKAENTGYETALYAILILITIIIVVWIIYRKPWLRRSEGSPGP